ncbi:MAG: FtsX-like permease family protein [Odoribacter sp.]|nr:FtsX-like permease family protein [Odoribacter sp.]
MYHKMDLGCEWNEVMYISLRNQAQKQKATVLKEEFLQSPQIKDVSLSLGTPLFINWNGPGWEWEGKDPVLNPLVNFSYVDEDWVKVYDIKLKEGDYFSELGEGILINKEMAELMGEGDLIGKFIMRGGEVMKITGVIDKMMYNNFKIQSSPLIIRPLTAENMRVVQVVSIRTEKENLAEVYEFVKQKSTEIFEEESVVRFLNHNVELMLRSENQTSKMVSFFSGLAIIISCLGLFGLAKFIIERKRKEIGIRRVSGAKVTEIVWLLNVNFIRPVLIGFLLACPISYYLMKNWLEDYMTKTTLSWWVFGISGLLIILITVLTLAWRSTAAAMENPVNSLRSE